MFCQDILIYIYQIIDLYIYHTYMTLLHSLYPHTREQFLTDMLDIYTKKWSVMINFLYFANVMKWRLLEDIQDAPYPEKAQIYKKALEEWDFLLADGIALQLFTRRHGLPQPPNLNGTDLNPRLFSQLTQQGSVSVYLLQFYDPRIGKDETYLEKGIQVLEDRFPGLQVARAEQILYSDPERDAKVASLHLELCNKAASDTSDYKVFFNSLGTPIQEMTTYTHAQQLKKAGLIVLNAWWTIDYLTWLEERAPSRVVKARVLETFWRICTQPKKNLKKFLVMFGVLRYIWNKLFKF